MFQIIKTHEKKFALGTITGENFGRLIIIDSLGDIRTNKSYFYPENFDKIHRLREWFC